MPLHVLHPPISICNFMLSWHSQKGKLELQQLLLLLKQGPEWLSLVAGGLQSCSHLVAKNQTTVHKPLHIPTNEYVRVQQCFIHNCLLRLGNQYQIPHKRWRSGPQAVRKYLEVVQILTLFPPLLPPLLRLELSDNLSLKRMLLDLFLSFCKTCISFACGYISS